MRLIWKNAARALALAGLTLLVACGGHRLALEPIPAGMNPTVEADKLAAELAAARQQQVHALAPNWFAKAEGSLADARGRIQGGGELAKIAEDLSLGRAQLRKAEGLAKVTAVTIPDAVKARAAALAAGAAKQEKEYAAAEKLFVKLAGEIEDDNFDYALRRQQEAVQAFQALTAKAGK